MRLVIIVGFFLLGRSEVGIDVNAYVYIASWVNSAEIRNIPLLLLTVRRNIVVVLHSSRPQVSLGVFAGHVTSPGVAHVTTIHFLRSIWCSHGLCWFLLFLHAAICPSRDLACACFALRLLSSSS